MTPYLFGSIFPVVSFIIKPEYAYRDEAHGDIPANSTLEFEIELLDILEPEKSLYDMTYEEKLAKAKQYKEEGTQKYKEGDTLRI